MKISRILLFCYTISVFWIVESLTHTIGSTDVINNKKSATDYSSSDHLSNTDLNHLLSLLDNGEVAVSDQGVSNIQQSKIENLDGESSKMTGVTSKGNEVTTTLPSLTASPVTKLTKRRKIRVLKTTTQGTTTTSTLAPKTTETSSEKMSTTPQPTISSISRREDTQLENLREIVPPSQQELVQQLSLLNSLLTSLGDNSTTTTSTPTSVVPKIKTSEFLSSKPESSSSFGLVKNAGKNNDSTSGVNEQSLALLNSLFGGSSGNANLNSAQASLLGIGASGSSNVATRQTSGKSQPDVLSTEALSDFLRQAAAVEAQGSAQNTIRNNHQASQNGHIDAASSEQVSNLLTLLGTLGNGQPQSPNTLLNLAQSNSIQQEQNNFLANLLRNQQQQQPLSNDLSNLFSQPEPQGHSLNLGNLLAQSSLSNIPGFGLLSSMGTLGSSIISTMSNILGGSGLGGKPRVRGKGIDTRLGLGYRLGDAADAQILWDIGPQLFTDSLNNEIRPPMTKSKSQQIDSHLQHVSKRGDTHAEKIAAKRLLQLQMYNNNKRADPTSNKIVTKMPLSLLDIWNSGKQKQLITKSILKIPQQFITPPGLFNVADAFQMSRNKNFMKRSSSTQVQVQQPKTGKFSDDSFREHSTLTAYEKMLLTHGDDFGMVDSEKKKRLNKPSTNSNLAFQTQKETAALFNKPQEFDKNYFGNPTYSPLPNIPEMKPEDPQNRLQPGRSKFNVITSPNHRDSDSHQNTAFNEKLPSTYEENRHFKLNRPNSQNEERYEESFQYPKIRSRPIDPQQVESYKENSRHRLQIRSRPYTPKEEPYKEIQHRPQIRSRPNAYEEKEEEYGENRHYPYMPSRPNFHEEEEYEENRHRPRSKPSGAYEEEPYEESRYHAHTRSRPNDHPDEEELYEEIRHRPRARRPNDYEEEPYEESRHRPRIRSRPKAHYKEEEPYEEIRQRPRARRPSTQEEQYEKSKHRLQKRPSSSKKSHEKESRRKNSFFGFSQFFSKLIGRNSPQRRPTPSDRRNGNNDNNPSERFTDSLMSESNDRFYARNSNVEPEFISNTNFVRKKNRFQTNPQLSHKTINMNYNTEADESFDRRNAVVNNPTLMNIEKQKLLNPSAAAVISESSSNNSTKRNDPTNDDPTSDTSPKQSIMSMFKNFLSSKTRNKGSNSTIGGSISSLTRLLSNPSSLNPMTILPTRKRKRPPQQLNIKTKLTIVDGKPQIVNTTEIEEPIVHIGEDMSFEDLTKLFGKNMTKAKGKKKLKTKKQNSSIKVEPRKDDEAADISIEEKVDTNGNESKEKDDEEEYDDDDDGLKGIFIDIDSGEVNVMKPVAQMTSFEPKKESSEEELDEYEDGDGDGIADADILRKQNIFDEIQKELKRNYDKMKKAHQRAEAKQKRKEELVSKGMDESVDVVSKYFDMIDDTHQNNNKGTKMKLKVL